MREDYGCFQPRMSKMLFGRTVQLIRTKGFAISKLRALFLSNICSANALNTRRTARLSRYNKQRKYNYQCSIGKLQFQPLMFDSSERIDNKCLFLCKESGNEKIIFSSVSHWYPSLNCGLQKSIATTVLQVWVMHTNRYIIRDNNFLTVVGYLYRTP